MSVYKSFRGCVVARGRQDVFHPDTVDSMNWKHWKANLDAKSCEACREQDGKIYGIKELPVPEPPLHPNCRCTIEVMQAVAAGDASKEGKNGADWWILNRGILPEYYIGIESLKNLGWKYGDAPVKYAPQKMVFGGIYRNDDGHLPDSMNRVWFEADMNYYSGKRNKHRLVWSNDGLIFVSYDHYTSFIEVIGG